MAKAAATGYTWVEIYERKDGRLAFRQRSANNQVISSSQGYTRRSSAIRGAKRAHPGRPMLERVGRGFVELRTA